MKVMLLAAGRGERMRPLTDHMPKPLLEAGSKPLIVWHIENLARAGLTDLVINHAHLGAQLESALGDGRRYGVSIAYSPESPSALETAGGIAHARHLLGDKPFAAINSDIFCNYDFARLPEYAAALRTSDDTAHLVLVDNPSHHPNGDFVLYQDRIVDHGNLAPGFNALRLTFSGIGIYRPSLFNPIPRGSKAPLAPLLRGQIAQGKVSGEHHRGIWMDVGTPQRLDELNQQLCLLSSSSLSKPHAVDPR